MKKLNVLKKFLAVTVSAFLLAILPNANALTVSAEEPATYYVMYQEPRGWVFQAGSTWDDSIDHREVYYLSEVIKNGDTVIVGNGNADHLLEINVHLGNLTIANNVDAFVKVSVAGGIDNCFALNGSFVSVTGNVFNAYVYNTATANFNNNVTNLYTYNNAQDSGPNIGVSGTVSYFMAEDPYQVNAPYGVDFAKGSFSMESGDLKTEGYLYTRDASGGPATSNPTAVSQPTTPQPASPAPGSSADEYDKVPKTGETSPVAWLSLAAIICGGAGLFLRKSANR